MIAPEANEPRYSPPPILAPTPDFFSTEPQDVASKPDRPFTKKTLVEINKRTFRCDLTSPDGANTDSLYCVFKKNEDGSPLITLSLKDRKDQTPHLSVTQLTGSNHIVILYSGSEYGRADWLCRFDTLSDTMFYTEFQPENSVLENTQDQNGNPLTLESKLAIQEACFDATLEPTIVPINGHNVMIQPDSRGYIAIFETIPNSTNPSNPTVLIQSRYKDESGKLQSKTIFSTDLNTLLQSLSLQEQTISGIPLPLPTPNLPLPSLTIPEKIVSTFNLSNPTIWESTSIGVGTKRNESTSIPTSTPTPNPAGLIIPHQETEPTNFEPGRIIEADGVTNHFIETSLSCPIGSNITIFSTSIDSPLAAQIQYEITTSHTYKPSWLNQLGQQLRDEANQYNSKLPHWLKKILGHNTTTPYTINHCKTTGLERSFQLLYRNLDNNNNVTVYGLDPTSRELIYFTLKAKEVPRYLTFSASVQGVPDHAMTNELLRQSYMLRINKYGTLNRGTVMIPANSIPNLPRDTSISNLTYYAELAHYNKSYPAIVLDQSGHEHTLFLPAGIPMREVTTKYQDGAYLITLEADLTNNQSQLDPATYQSIIDLFGYIPERVLLQYPLVDLYTSYTSPPYLAPTPTPTPTPSSPVSELQKINTAQTSMKLHRFRQINQMRAQQKNYQHRV